MKNEFIKTIMIGIALLWLVTGVNQVFYANDTTPTFTIVKDYLLQEILHARLDGCEVYLSSLPVAAGTEIRDWQKPVCKAAEESWIAFVDEVPTANWEHPARIIIINSKKLNRHFNYKVTTPPDNFLDLVKVYTEINPSRSLSATKQNHSVTRLVPARFRGQEEHCYAVLISGGASQGSNHVRYWNDTSNIYKCLVNYYGYLDDHIYALVSDGLDPAPDKSNGENSDPDLDGDGDDDIMYPAQNAYLEQVFNELAGILTAQDTLFIFSTDHGGSESGWDVYLNMWGETCADDLMASFLAPLQAGNIIVTMEQCYSGGFIDDLSAEGRVISTAARYDEYSWAMPPDYVYDEYVFHWTAAVNWEDAYGVPVNADTNGDDAVTMDEAYIYARDHDTASEHPQYDETPVGLGAEISLFGGGPTSAGILSLDRERYGCSDTISLQVMDIDIAGGSCPISVLSDTEPDGEDFELVEIEEGVFEGSIETEEGDPAADGILQVHDGDTITAKYYDEDNGEGVPVWVMVDVVTDCSGPTISDIQITDLGSATATVLWTTDEPASSRINYGVSPDLGEIFLDEEFLTEHTAVLTGLESCTLYYFDVVSTDEAGNETVDNNGGAHYHFTTYQIHLLLEEPLDTDPGWATEGQWAFGVPTGQGGEYGDPDPSSGSTGSNVYGYNLNGDYTNYMPEYHLTSTAIDCTGCFNVRLNFWRWLGVERSTYDHAYVRISDNGSSYSTAWENPDSETNDGEWVEFEYDISDIADDKSTVYLRWTMGDTDVGWTYCGWNIDDIRVFYESECTEPTPTPPPTYTPTAMSPTYTSVPPTPTEGPPETVTPTQPPEPTETPTSPPLPTATPTSPPLPTETPTSPPLPSATPGPEPTATPDSLTIYLNLNQEIFHSGDRFFLTCGAYNPGEALNADQYIILDVLHNYWFWPAWTQDPGCRLTSLSGYGAMQDETILDFTWPEEAGTLMGVKVWAAFCSTGTYQLISNVSFVEWGYE